MRSENVAMLRDTLNILEQGFYLFDMMVAIINKHHAGISYSKGKGFHVHQNSNEF